MFSAMACFPHHFRCDEKTTNLGPKNHLYWVDTDDISVQWAVGRMRLIWMPS